MHPLLEEIREREKFRREVPRWEIPGLVLVYMGFVGFIIMLGIWSLG